MNARSIGERFLALTLIGFLAAGVACTFVVWSLSGPFVREATQEHLRGVAQQQASSVAFTLDEVFDRSEHLAQLPAIVDFTRGSIDDVSAVADGIATFRTEAVQNVMLLDFEGQVLYETPPTPSSTQVFADAEYWEGFSQVHRVQPGGGRPGRILVREEPLSGNTHFLISVPVMIEGAMEGAVVIEKRRALDTVLLGGSRLVTPFQRDLARENGYAATAPVPGMPLHIVVGEELETASAGTTPTSALVMRISFGITAVLLIAFFAMFLFGRRHLVAPTRALAESRELLTEQKEVLKRQSDELRELAAVAELSLDAVTVNDRHAKIIWVNESFTQLTGYTRDEAKGQKPGQLLQNRNTDPETVARIRSALRAGRPVREEILNVHKSGKPYWATISISPIVGEDGEVERFAAISSDITERRRIQEALSRAQQETEYQATHDTLTGLPNRRYLDQVLASEVGNGAAPRTLIRVDLDFFKNVNDTHGHAAGDHVLKVVSKALTSLTRKDDLVARVGGDEFVVLLRQAATSAQADALCERLRSEICKDIVFEGATCRVGASFGVASALDGLVDNEKLLVGADAALYVSKEQGRNTTTLYTPEVHADVLTKRRSSAEIERAIEREEFEPYFQPQIDAKTRGFAGLEALVRWHHPEQGVLLPGAFLPLAERLSLVPEIDNLVYKKGLGAVLRLNADGFAVPKVSFNVGAKQLENPFLRSIFNSYELGETRIAFEVLESVLVEEQTSLFANQIDLLRDLGFGVEVDDFGSGHASVVGLMQLRPDAMKLDQRLILPLNRDPNAVTTVRALIEIGQSNGIKVTAEGVETEEHAQLLTELGVDTLQGYRFAPPLPVDQLRDFLRALPQDASSAA
ncbi:MAG: EAL domain-containing protein [Pseudomonadota bacterium]